MPGAVRQVPLQQHLPNETLQLERREMHRAPATSAAASVLLSGWHAVPRRRAAIMSAAATTVLLP